MSPQNTPAEALVARVEHQLPPRVRQECAPGVHHLSLTSRDEQHSAAFLQGCQERVPRHLVLRVFVDAVTQAGNTRRAPAGRGHAHSGHHHTQCHAAAAQLLLFSAPTCLKPAQQAISLMKGAANITLAVSVMGERPPKALVNEGIQGRKPAPAHGATA
jgi:hypothetical protein